MANAEKSGLYNDLKKDHCCSTSDKDLAGNKGADNKGEAISQQSRTHEWLGQPVHNSFNPIENENGSLHFNYGRLLSKIWENNKHRGIKV